MEEGDDPNDPVNLLKWVDPARLAILAMDQPAVLRELQQFAFKLQEYVKLALGQQQQPRADPPTIQATSSGDDACQMEQQQQEQHHEPSPEVPRHEESLNQNLGDRSGSIQTTSFSFQGGGSTTNLHHSHDSSRSQNVSEPTQVHPARSDTGRLPTPSEEEQQQSQSREVECSISAPHVRTAEPEIVDLISHGDDSAKDDMDELQHQEEKRLQHARRNNHLKSQGAVRNLQDSEEQASEQSVQMVTSHQSLRGRRDRGGRSSSPAVNANDTTPAATSTMLPRHLDKPRFSVPRKRRSSSSENSTSKESEMATYRVSKKPSAHSGDGSLRAGRPGARSDRKSPNIGISKVYEQKLDSEQDLLPCDDHGAFRLDDESNKRTRPRAYSSDESSSEDDLPNRGSYGSGPPESARCSANKSADYEEELDSEHDDSTLDHRSPFRLHHPPSRDRKPRACTSNSSRDPTHSAGDKPRSESTTSSKSVAPPRKKRSEKKTAFYHPTLDEKRDEPRKRAARISLRDLSGKCAKLEPLRPCFQGDEAEALRFEVPDFNDLINFPEARSRVGSLAPGKRNCVMCGHAFFSLLDMDAAPNNNPSGAIISKYHKGLCTNCDEAVWEVVPHGLQIKWCKGCRVFRHWAAFGEKGHLTTCVPCRKRSSGYQRQAKKAQKRRHIQKAGRPKRGLKLNIRVGGKLVEPAALI